MEVVVKDLTLSIVEGSDRGDFTKKVNCFLKGKDVFSVKMQRNLFYAGVGSSEGYKGRGFFWSKKNREARRIAKGKIKLQESFLAFILVRKGKR
jgi:hypothetical protein